MAAQAKETDALVLNCIEHGESDVIVTLFCQDSGRLTAIAKGAKKSKKRFVNKLELFSFLHISYQLKANRSLAFLAEAELHSSFLHLRKNLEMYSIASVIREFLLIGVRENEPDLHIFRLTLWALHNLQQNPRTVLCLFLIRFYDYIGYRPDLQSCANCDTEVNNQNNYYFNIAGGRLICSGCAPRLPGGIALSPGTIKMFRSAQDQPLDRLHRLKLSGSILQETITLLQRYGNQLFQRDIISWKMVRHYFRQESER